MAPAPLVLRQAGGLLTLAAEEVLQHAEQSAGTLWRISTAEDVSSIVAQHALLT